MRIRTSWIGSGACALGWLLSIEAWAAQVTLDVLDANHKPLADVVVALEPSYKPEFARPLESTMDQREVRFSPRVLAVRTNTWVYFLNNDPIFHHVYSFSPAKRFELGVKQGKSSEPVLFDRPGKVVLGCNIHDQMLAYIYVLDTEWFGVTGANGRVRLTQLPAGDYELVIRHPRLEQPAREPLSLTANDKVNRRFMLPELMPDPQGSYQGRAPGGAKPLVAR